MPSASAPLGYVMQVHCPGAGSEGPHDVTVVDQCKMFRNLTKLRFEGRIHEQVLENIRRAGGDVAFTDIFVVHAGADHTPEGRRRKLRRDVRLLHLERRERPNHPFVYFNLGMTYADAGRHAKAVRALRRSLELSEPHESHVRKVYALLAASYRALGLAAEARQAAADGLKLYPKDPELLFRQAMLAHDDGRLGEAEQAYLAALANDDAPHFGSFDRGIVGFKARHNLAAVYADMGALDKAEGQWRRIVADVPDYAAGWQGLVETLLAQGRAGAASDAVAAMPDVPQLRATREVLLARVAEAIGDVATSRDILARAIERDPADAAPLEALCRVLFHYGEPAAAADALRRLAQKQPHDAATHHNLGTALLRSGRHDEAATAFRASLRRRPKWPLTHLSLGHALRNAGRDAEAREAFRACLRLAPGPFAAEARRQLDAVAEVVRLPAAADAIHHSALVEK